ncbi:hypothetical protein L2E82_00677 [Cichorium intybus]|uniref:Uncharacterized protein n=1 Tax=Cichorium intybus TaxID=13427 RepID=A0ACB9GZC0_CICIN|nr:hypothetical protein L2E82_00677 [Cichorium intybus]
MQSNAKLSKTQSPSTDEEITDMSRVLYASAVGSIMYAMTCTRPDVAFALSMVSRYQGNPGRAHWTAVKNILKYLRKTKNFVLVLGGSDTLRVDGYTDASFQTDRDNGRSQSGWVFLLNGGAVTWKSSKQETVADSICESEYIATSEAAKEAAWLKNFIGDLGVVPSIQELMELFCDNEGAVALTKEPIDHGKSRHIDRKYHYIRHRVEEGHLIVKRVSSEDNPADPLTKALSRVKNYQHARRIGLTDDISFYTNEISEWASPLPFMYLGVPVGENMNRKATWRPIVERFHSKLSVWKSKTLSFGGRITLAKAVLGNLPTYFLSLFAAPTGVIKELEKIQRQFIWRGLRDTPGINWISWEKLTAPKHVGGMGLGSLRTMNLSLLVKWLWKLKSDPSSLWARVIVGLHKLSNVPNYCFKKGSLPGVWSNIVSTIAALEKLNTPIEEIITVTSDGRTWSSSFELGGDLCVSKLRERLDRASFPIKRGSIGLESVEHKPTS